MCQRFGTCLRFSVSDDSTGNSRKALESSENRTTHEMCRLVVQHLNLVLDRLAHPHFEIVIQPALLRQVTLRWQVEQLMQLLKGCEEYNDSFLTTNTNNAISCLEAEPEQEPDLEPYTLDGFNDALIGKPHDKVIYDYMKCVKIFMDRESWTEDESIEWMEYNVVCQDKAIFKMCPT